MKKLWILPLLMLAVACSGEMKQEAATEDVATEAVVEEVMIAQFGADITEDGAQDISSVVSSMSGKDSMNIKLAGRVEKVCQVKGCWMTMAYGEGESMRISFRDYGFFVPKDIDGKDVVVEGTVFMETTSVEDLKHFAEDEGLSPEEIEKITEPETALTFIADGVIVKDYAPTMKEEAEEEHDHDHDHGDHEHDHAG
jgi:hypothetical protein